MNNNSNKSFIASNKYKISIYIHKKVENTSKKIEHGKLKINEGY